MKVAGARYTGMTVAAVTSEFFKRGYEVAGIAWHVLEMPV